jgi:hypothetical protein
MSVKIVSFKHVSALLEPSPDNFQEAFEFRWLEQTGPAQQRIFLQASHEEDMIRCTFPFHTPNGRGRIWVKRCYRKINKEDVNTLLTIARFLSANLDYPIVTDQNIGALIRRFITVDQILNMVKPTEINQYTEEMK